MSELSLHLQDGFQHDTVIIRVGEREIYQKTDVTTRTQIGLADMMTTEVVDGSVAVQIEVPTRGARRVIRIAVPDILFVGVSLEADGQVSYQARRETMGYA
jgi:hypothetical protein